MIGLLVLGCGAALTLAGCTQSPAEDARGDVLDRAVTQAAEAETRADLYADVPGGRRGNDEVLRWLAEASGGQLLTASVHDPDPHAEGLLASTEIAVVGMGSGWLWSQVEEPYDVCLRFEVHRTGDNPRKISVNLIDCPPEAAPSP